MRTTGEVKFGSRMSFLLQAGAGEYVGLEEVADGIWRLAYRRSPPCYPDLRSATPRVLDEPEPEGIVEHIEE